MKAKKAKDIKVSALQSAAGAVTDHNAELSSHLKRGVAIFTETPPISERLRCETNGAHKYIEDFATALKALPRGCGPVKKTMKRMLSSCRELIRRLKGTESLLPLSVPEADRRAFLDSIELVATEELGFYNLVTGESGLEPDCNPFLYRKRINNSVRDIKKKFTQLNIAIQHIERDMRQKPDNVKPTGVSKMRRSRSDPATRGDILSAARRLAKGDIYERPGPKPTDEKKKQIGAALNYKKTHCGCTYRNACFKSFVHMPNGYASPKSLYESTREKYDSVAKR